MTAKNSAYLLVSHGSRDPRPQQAIDWLATLFCQRLQGVEVLQPLGPINPQKMSQLPPVETACLELAPIPLHQQMQQFGQKVLAAGWDSVQILPLFLLPGVHVTEDIPQEVALAQAFFGQRLEWTICPYLGSHPGLKQLLARQQQAFQVDRWILLSHGSRRLGGNQPVEALAKQLSAIPAYWSVEPSLSQQVATLAATGVSRMGILPYFLFPGGITDAIAQQVNQLQPDFPQVSLQLAGPIGASVELADCLWDLTL